MRKKITSLAIILSILSLNSCAVGALIGLGGLALGTYEETKQHAPNILPNSKKSSEKIDNQFGFDCTKNQNDKNRSECFNQFTESFLEKENNIKIDHKGISKNNKDTPINQNQQVNQNFKKTQNDAVKLVTAHDKIEKSVFSRDAKTEQVGTPPKQLEQSALFDDVKTKKLVTPKDEIEETIFFENLESNFDTKSPTIVEEQQVAQVLEKNKELVVVETVPQEDGVAIKERVVSKNFISSKLLNWVKAWENQNIDLYLSYYSKEFKGQKNSHSKWEMYRRRALTNNTNISIQLSNIQIYQNKKLIEINFSQSYKSETFADFGVKELVWEKQESGWRIIKENWMPTQKAQKVKASANSPTALVSSQLIDWLKAWGSQDIKLYISFYSKSFKDPKRSRSEWVAFRQRALKANSNITIEVSNLRIYQNKETIEINFIQHFKSDNFSDVGVKELIWTKDRGRWKILKETWMQI